jgi:hypothetical protein
MNKIFRKICQMMNMLKITWNNYGTKINFKMYKNLKKIFK